MEPYGMTGTVVLASAERFGKEPPVAMTSCPRQFGSLACELEVTQPKKIAVRDDIGSISKASFEKANWRGQYAPDDRLFLRQAGKLLGGVSGGGLSLAFHRGSVGHPASEVLTRQPLVAAREMRMHDLVAQTDAKQDEEWP